MAYRIPQSLIEEANAAAAPAHDEDYHALGRRLARGGLGIDAVTQRVGAFAVAVPTRGVGPAGCPLSRARRAARHLRQIGGLRDNPAVDARDADLLAAFSLGQSLGLRRT